MQTKARESPGSKSENCKRLRLCEKGLLSSVLSDTAPVAPHDIGWRPWMSSGVRELYIKWLEANRQIIQTVPKSGYDVFP